MKVYDVEKQVKPLYHLWSNCVGAGRANEGLRADWQKHLEIAVEKCGFRYLRFHGLLHNDMHIYREENGVVSYNFQYVDELFDAMLARNIRPFVEFGFMPGALASTSRTQFWWKGHVSPPSNWEKWADLLRACLNHWVYRYGKKEVQNWYFEIWNEPNLKPFWDGTRSQYFHLYQVSVEAIKSVDSAFRVGGPATSNFVPDERFDGEEEDKSRHQTFLAQDINAMQWKGVWIKEFLDFCEENHLPVDFVSTHPYPTDFALDGYGVCRGLTRHKESTREDILWLQKVIAESAYPYAEIHLTEWSSSPSSRDMSHDYLPAATYVMKTNVECSDLANSLSYWTFTDVFEEAGAGPEAFHGGFGLLTLQGIKKPTFYAYEFLNRLGDIEIGREDGYLLTKKGGVIQGVFYHYPDDYQDTVPMSPYPDQKAARICQEIQAVKKFSIVVNHLEPNSPYLLEIADRDSVAIALWNQMGKPNSPTKEQVVKLQACAENTKKQIFYSDDEGTLQLNFALPAWAIASLTVMDRN